MNHLEIQITAMTHVIYAALRTTVFDGGVEASDRGAVSIEQVLWYAAAAVSVAVIAGIIWATVRDSANDVAPTTPAAP